jgi:hypothetical protein
VDRKKRILFCSIESRGTEHYSTAFKRTGLYQWLLDNWWRLERYGYYFIGDSAYALLQFIITPYGNAMHRTPKDNFNFFHSSSRIVVECAFGEIDLRWGILWRPLQFSLELNCKVINACMQMHNFIVDFWEQRSQSKSIDLVDRSVFDDECRRFLSIYLNKECEVGVYGGELDICWNENFEPLQDGRPNRKETEREDVGKQWQDKIRDEIIRQRLIRPATNWFCLNNQIYDTN